MKSERTILLIEDDTDLREALARQFNLQEDFKVEHASTAAEGIDKAEAVRPDLIILDVELPDMDGRDRVVRAVKPADPDSCGCA